MFNTLSKHYNFCARVFIWDTQITKDLPLKITALGPGTFIASEVNDTEGLSPLPLVLCQPRETHLVEMPKGL